MVWSRRFQPQAGNARKRYQTSNFSPLRELEKGLVCTRKLVRRTLRSHSPLAVRLLYWYSDSRYSSSVGGLKLKHCAILLRYMNLCKFNNTIRQRNKKLNGDSTNFISFLKSAIVKFILISLQIHSTVIHIAEIARLKALKAKS